MKSIHTLVSVGMVVFVMFGNTLVGQEFGRYREFTLGSTTTTLSEVTGTAASDLKVVHQRPALIQELTWRLKYAAGRQSAGVSESAEQVVFSFYDDRLFRIAVDYDRERTEGLSNADMVEAVSTVYGPTIKPRVLTSRQISGEDLGTLIAQWGTVDSAVALYRQSSFASRFRLVVTSEATAALARVAITKALTLDAQEAPQREAARARKEVEDRRVAEEKARAESKATFRP